MKKVVIVGGGVSGLSAGIYARLAGLEATILEKNRVEGGFCTGWDRGGYHIDGCVHWLTGTNPASSLYRLWVETGVIDPANNSSIHRPGHFGVYEHPSGTVTLWRDLDRLREEWSALSPSDADEIANTVRDIRAMQGMGMPVDKPFEQTSTLDSILFYLSMGKAGKVAMKSMGLTCAQYAERFSHPSIRNAIADSLPEGTSATAFLFAMGAFSSDNGDAPIGGSRAMSARMRARFESLGGVFVSGAEAIRVERDGETITGVTTKDGTTYGADYCVAACDVKETFHGLLGMSKTDRLFDPRFADPERYPLPTSVQVSLSCAHDLSSYPETISFPTEPFDCSGRTMRRVWIKHYAHEPSFAPEGHTVIVAHFSLIDRDYLWWKNVSRDRARYLGEKAALGEAIRERVEARYPELAGSLAVIDVATPMTYERYCNAFHGAWMSFTFTPRSRGIRHNGRVEGIKNLVLAGQWMDPPGGLPAAVTQGKFAIRRIEAMERKSRTKPRKGNG